MKPRLVFTAAVMDLFHAGHRNLLERMNQRTGAGGLVGVILHDDLSTYRNKARFPVQSLERRAFNLLSTGLVEIVRFTFSQDPTREFAMLNNQFRDAFQLYFMRGDDWSDFPGRASIEQLGIPIELVPYTEGVSSTAIRSEISR